MARRYGVSGILLIIAIIIFLLVAFKVGIGGFNLVALGLAFFAAAFLFRGGPYL